MRAHSTEEGSDEAAAVSIDYVDERRRNAHRSAIKAQNIQFHSESLLLFRPEPRGIVIFLLIIYIFESSSRSLRLCAPPDTRDISLDFYRSPLLRFFRIQFIIERIQIGFHCADCRLPSRASDIALFID